MTKPITKTIKLCTHIRFLWRYVWRNRVNAFSNVLHQINTYQSLIDSNKGQFFIKVKYDKNNPSNFEEIELYFEPIKKVVTHKRLEREIYKLK